MANEDQGTNKSDLRIEIGIDAEKKLVVIEFQNPLKWLALNTKEARRVVDILLEKIIILEHVPESENNAKEKEYRADSV